MQAASESISTAQLKPFITPRSLQTGQIDSLQQGPTREVFGFATAGSLGDPTIGYPSWNFDLLSTVAFFGIHVRYNGRLIGDGSFSIWDSSVLTGLVNTAHAHGVKVVVTIIPPNHPVELCDALYNRATTVFQIVNQVKLKGVDGVNIDYEGQLQMCQPTDPSLTPQTNQSMVTALAHDLRVALDAVKPGYYLSIDTYSGSAAGNDGFFNIGALSQYVDSFFIMAYDMDYYGWAQAGCTRYCMNPVSPLSTYGYNDTISVTQYSAVAGADKTILGLPYYGRVACVAKPVAHAYPTKYLGAATYTGAAAVARSPDVKPGTFVAHRDATDRAGLERWDTWYDNKLGCWREMYWDDTTSLATRYNLVNRTNLRGVGFWTLNYGGGSPELWDLLSAYFKVWSAGYDMSQAPSQWVAGQPLTFNVTVTNSGTFTWPSGGTNPIRLNLHFTKKTGGSKLMAYWLNSYSFPLPNDVPQGQSAVVPVTVTAPMTSGSMYLESEMFKNQQFWFTQTQPIPVSVAAQTWIAGFDVSQAPTAWQAGQSKTFIVTVTNKGNVPWPAGGSNPTKVNVHFTTAAGGNARITSWLTSQSFRLPADLPPGQSVQLTVPITAPASSGYRYLEVQTFRDHLFWFKQWQPVAVVVYGPWGVSYDLSHVPTTWAVGQTKTFQVTLTNQGTQTWSTGTNPVKLNFHFTTVAGGSARIAYWLTNQSFRLPSDVAPGASVAVNVTVMPPTRSGSIYLEAQVFKDHQFWFQQWSTVRVYNYPAWTAAFESCQVQTAWSPKQTQTVTITVTNLGSQTWPAAGSHPVRLDLHFTTVPGGSGVISKWLTSQIYPLPSDVAPGASVQLTVSATAPASTVQLYLEAQMFKDHQFWFPTWQWSPASVGTLPWGANYNLCGAPRAWTPGQSQTVDVTLTNAGTQAWPSTGANPVRLNLHFTSRVGGSAASASWFNNIYVSLPSDVAPGQSITLSITVTAPSTVRGMYLEGQLIKQNEFWFSQWQRVIVKVA